jgi:hypothetical protein
MTAPTDDPWGGEPIPDPFAEPLTWHPGTLCPAHGAYPQQGCDGCPPWTQVAA